MFSPLSEWLFCLAVSSERNQWICQKASVLNYWVICLHVSNLPFWIIFIFILKCLKNVLPVYSRYSKISHSKLLQKKKFLQNSLLVLDLHDKSRFNIYKINTLLSSLILKNCENFDFSLIHYLQHFVFQFLIEWRLVPTTWLPTSALYLWPPTILSTFFVNQKHLFSCYILVFGDLLTNM